MIRRVCSAIVLAFLAACGSVSNVRPPLQGPLLTSSSASSGARLYVAKGGSAPALLEYGLSDGALTRRMTGNLGNVEIVSIDRFGTVYAVGDYYNNRPRFRIHEFDPGATVPSRALLHPLQFVRALLFDKSGDLLVLDQSANRVFIYPPKATKPSRSLHDGLCWPTAMTQDSAGNLFVSNGCSAPEVLDPGSVTTYAPSGALTGTFTKGIESPYGIATDGRGNLYVGEPFGSGPPYHSVMNQYTEAGNLVQSTTLTTDSAAYLRSSMPVADSSGNLYLQLSGCVASSGGKGHCVNQIQEYAPNAKAPAWVLNATKPASFGPFALDRAGNLYVIVYPTPHESVCEVRMFAAGSHASRVILHGSNFYTIAVKG